MSSRPSLVLEVAIDPDQLLALVGEATAARARKGFRKRFEDQIDPDRVLNPEERSRHANEAPSEHMAALGKSGAASRPARMNAVAT